MKTLLRKTRQAKAAAQCCAKTSTTTAGCHD